MYNREYMDEFLWGKMEVKNRQRFYNKLNRVRKVVQLLAVFFLIAVPFLNRMGVHWIIGTLYSISIGELDIVDPVMALQTVLLTKNVYIPLLIAVVVPVLLAFIFGRVFCSWVCPKNTISDWLDTLQQRIMRGYWRKVRFKLSEKNPNPVIFWGILAALVFTVSVSGFPLLGYLSVPGIISSQISQAVLGIGNGLELALVLIIFAVEVMVVRRYWCKFLCPVGAFLSIFRIKRTLRIQYDMTLCSCGGQTAQHCQIACPLGLSPKRDHIYPYCFHCGLCLAACEKTGNCALSFKPWPRQ